MKTTLEKTKGYSGNQSGKTWVAEITQDGRSFVEPTSIDYGDGRDWFRKPKATRFDTYEIEKNGLYEVCELGEVRYRVVYTKNDGSTGWMKIDAERFSAMKSMIEAGNDSEEARIATKSPQ